jgi:tellurite resistance protein
MQEVTMSGTPLSPGEPSPHADALRDEVAHLHEAVRSQRDIGMAIGLVSARFGCSTEQAWRTMLRVSQDSNTKIRTVARVLVATHDGTADADDQEVLARFVEHLPVSGWSAGSAGEE